MPRSRLLIYTSCRHSSGYQRDGNQCPKTRRKERKGEQFQERRTIPGSNTPTPLPWWCIFSLHPKFILVYELYIIYFHGRDWFKLDYTNLLSLSCFSFISVGKEVQKQVMLLLKIKQIWYIISSVCVYVHFISQDKENKRKVHKGDFGLFFEPLKISQLQKMSISQIAAWGKDKKEIDVRDKEANRSCNRYQLKKKKNFSQ